MVEETSPYLELLKKVLVDYQNVGGYEYHSLDQVKTTWKTSLLSPLDRLLRWRNFAIVKQKVVSQTGRENGSDWPARALTMIGLKRLDNLEYCIRTAIKDQIPGDLMETGVWRGGATIFMKAVLRDLKAEDRQVWLADSFAGLPAPKPEEYPSDKEVKLHQEPILAVSLEEVKENFRRFDLLDEKVRFIKGWFSDTLPQAPVEQLSVLRLDGDLYESTHLALEHLYPKLSPGGFLIVDDYNAFAFCKKAVDDYRQAKGIGDEIIPIDKEAVFWRKSG